MNFRRLRSALFVSLLFGILLMILTACGGGGTTDNTQTEIDHEIVFNNNVIADVSDDERDAADLAISNAWTASQNLSTIEQARAITAAMQTQPAYRSAGITGGNPWGRYTDGIVHIYHVADPDVAEPVKDGQPLISSPLTSNSNQTRVAPEGILATPTAYVIDSMEAARATPFPKILPQLAQAGFQVTQLRGTVDDWNSVRDASLLIVHAHGDMAYFEDGSHVFLLSTDEEVSRAGNRKYRGELSFGEMAICSNPVSGQPGVLRKVYGLTSNYVFPARMFTNNSYMFAMSCESGRTSDLFDALKKRGLTNFSGWRGSVSAYDAARTCEYLIDRCLGENKIGAVSEGDPQGFTLPEIKQKLTNTFRGDANNPGGFPDYPYDTSYEFYKSDTNPPIVKLVWFGESDLLSLVPIVNDVQYNADRTSLILTGHFGPPGGAVVMDGSFLTITSWTPEKIIVDKPTATSGTIRVQNVGQASANGFLKSNSYKWVALTIKMSPVATQLDKLANQTFTVQQDTGTIPTNARYKWIVTGEGTINGSSTATTTTPNATYRAPNQDGNFSLKCQVLSSSGNILAEASAPILVGQTPSIAYTVTNMTDPRFPNGSFAFSDGVGTIYSPLSGPDQGSFDYNLDPDENVRVAISFENARNQPLTVGQTFQRGQGLGTFSFATAESLTEPNPNNLLFEFGNNGTLTITSVSNLAGGVQFVTYTFTVFSGATQVVSGTGACRLTRI